MVLITWNNKGLGLFGLNIPWDAWPGGVVAAEGTRIATGIQSGTSENGILNLTYMIGGGIASYYGLKALKK